MASSDRSQEQLAANLDAASSCARAAQRERLARAGVRIATGRADRPGRFVAPAPPVPLLERLLGYIVARLRLHS